MTPPTVDSTLLLHPPWYVYAARDLEVHGTKTGNDCGLLTASSRNCALLLLFDYQAFLGPHFFGVLVGYCFPSCSHPHPSAPSKPEWRRSALDCPGAGSISGAGSRAGNCRQPRDQHSVSAAEPEKRRAGRMESIRDAHIAAPARLGGAIHRPRATRSARFHVAMADASEPVSLVLGSTCPQQFRRFRRRCFDCLLYLVLLLPRWRSDKTIPGSCAPPQPSSSGAAFHRNQQFDCRQRGWRTGGGRDSGGSRGSGFLGTGSSLARLMGVGHGIVFVGPARRFRRSVGSRGDCSCHQRTLGEGTDPVGLGSGHRRAGRQRGSTLRNQRAGKSEYIGGLLCPSWGREGVRRDRAFRRSGRPIVYACSPGDVTGDGPGFCGELRVAIRWRSFQNHPSAMAPISETHSCTTHSLLFSSN